MRISTIYFKYTYTFFNDGKTEKTLAENSPTSVAIGIG